MKNKYLFVFTLLLSILVISIGMTTIYCSKENRNEVDDKINIVTSFYPMYIAAANIVGDSDAIELTNLSEPQTGCLHDFQLTPEDLKLLSTADIFIINGGGIEGFMSEIAAAYPDLKIVEASKGIELLSDEDEENAHAWMSVRYYKEQVENIASGLSEIDPDNKEIYTKNASVYTAKLENLEKQQESIRASLEGENIIIFHEAYDYVAEDYGMNVSFVMDLDEERQISAGEVADVVAQIKDNGVRYIFAEELYGKSMGDTVEKETDVKVIYIDPLNRGEYDADSYVNGMQENINIIKAAFGI